MSGRAAGGPGGLTPDDAQLTDAYLRAAEAATRLGLSRSFVERTRRFAEGLWRDYVPILDAFERPLAGSVFLDFGAKQGHLAPLLAAAGVRDIVCVDVEARYLEEGEQAFGAEYPVRFIRSEACLLPLEPDSVDALLLNEVISHVHPSLLDALFDEAARILRVGGELLISDGNNLAHRDTRLQLMKLYDLWENGPESKELGKTCYRSQREALVRRAAPALDREAAEYVATNTSGMFGHDLAEAARRFADGGGIVRRPYRAGACPVNPNHGTVMERGFYPDEVEYALRARGLKASQLLSRQHRFTHFTNPNMRGSTKNFTILAKKHTTSLDELIETARRDHDGRERALTIVWPFDGVTEESVETHGKPPAADELEALPPLDSWRPVGASVRRSPGSPNDDEDPIWEVTEAARASQHRVELMDVACRSGPHALWLRAKSVNRRALRLRIGRASVRYDLFRNRVVAPTGITAGLESDDDGWFRVWLRVRLSSGTTTIRVNIDDERCSSDYMGDGSSSMLVCTPRFGVSGV